MGHDSDVVGDDPVALFEAGRDSEGVGGVRNALAVEVAPLSAAFNVLRAGEFEERLRQLLLVSTAGGDGDRLRDRKDRRFDSGFD